MVFSLGLGVPLHGSFDALGAAQFAAAATAPRSVARLAQFVGIPVHTMTTAAPVTTTARPSNLKQTFPILNSAPRLHGPAAPRRSPATPTPQRRARYPLRDRSDRCSRPRGTTTRRDESVVPWSTSHRSSLSGLPTVDDVTVGD